MISILSLMLLSSLAFSQVRNFAEFQRFNFVVPQSTRQLGMGTAFIAIADDEYLLYHNPAGLIANPRKFSKDNQKPLFSILGGQVAVSVETIETISNTFFRATTDFTGSLDQQIDLLFDLVQGSANVFVNLNPINVVAKKWGIQSFIHSRGNIQPINHPAIVAIVEARVGAGLNLGISIAKISLKKAGYFSIGLGIKAGLHSDLEEQLGIDLLGTVIAEEQEISTRIIRSANSGYYAGAILGLLFDFQKIGIRLGITVDDFSNIFLFYRQTSIKKTLWSYYRTR